MSRRLFIIVTVVLTLFLLSLLGYYFLTRNSGSGEDSGGSGFNFFPFGNKGGDTDGSGEGSITGENGSSLGENGEGGETGGQIPQAENFTKRLRKISAEPVSGMGLSETRVGTLIRYIEKATGHIYEVETFSPKVSRISNTTIPLSYEAYWSGNPDYLVARYLGDDNETIETYSLKIGGVSTTTINTTTGIVLPENITDVSLFGNSIFYIVEDQNSVSGYVSSLDGKNRKEIWRSEMKEFNSQYVNDKTVALTTKPHTGVPGYTYLVDTGNGSVRKVLSGIPGLSALANGNATEILFTQFDSIVETFVVNASSQVRSQAGHTVFPDKCVWSKKTVKKLFCAVSKEYSYPENLINWYKGVIQFNDEIYSLNTDGGFSSLVIDLETESDEKIDVMRPMLSENEQYLVFINKIDNSLWSLDLLKTPVPTQESPQTGTTTGLTL
jgi:hypothetical protein